MTTPAAPSDPGEIPFPDVSLVRTPDNFETPLGTWGSSVRSAVLALRQLLVAGGLLGSGGRLEQSYVKPVGGIPAADLAPGVGTARGAVMYFWNATTSAFQLGPGQTEDGVSPQHAVGGPAGAWETSPLRDAERPSIEDAV